LDEQPGDHRVGNRNSIDFASLKLGEKIGHPKNYLTDE
jgi:hypothetical protein